MIEWYEDLYLDGITKKNVQSIKKQIEKKKLKYPYFCVTIATNENNLLDIMNVNELLFPYYANKDIFIVGLASTRKQAKYIAIAIVDKIYKETGGFDVRKYFSSYRKIRPIR